jgi:pimeloyl-ACP methyl ester carboxylesterase
VAFHGYGQTGREYEFFEGELLKRFTVIAIDFFWHGGSEWKETNDFREEDMKNIALGIVSQEHIVARKFSVCSFSMGERMARALVKSFPDRIEHVILLSPPTFSFNRFLNFTTRTFLGLRLFRYFVKNNRILVYWVKLLNRVGILNRSVYVFTSKFIGRPDRIEKVFKTWYAQRRLNTRFNTFARLVDAHDINVILIVGKKDSLTPPRKLIRHMRNLKNRKIYIIRKKHELATPETKRILEKLFAV